MGGDAHDQRRRKILRWYVPWAFFPSRLPLIRALHTQINRHKYSHFISATGGNFRARLSFPPTYPLSPPTLKFLTPLFHPNIYADGTVCISILHPPEDDAYGYEKASERWSPVQTPVTILLSVISLLNGPNDESPANVEAARLFRLERETGDKAFRRRCRDCVRATLEED